eukprot:CAMPEP_0117590864 /NCGR_PEP_ID=MMETSP0784-20121206/71209_1 /TAXON_ID=39447 /ORGANISM="" /LENGTH=398 /DNA_ID=CAMNT_0005392513 /DNA_START=56 /DNA_END=1249 /DNA_ORIENTATION=-
MQTFVATRAPAGWKLGRWSPVGGGDIWEERKTDDQKVAYTFDCVGNTDSGVMLRMRDSPTEVILLEGSAQIFVGGKYFGEYGGHWQDQAVRGGMTSPVSRGGVADQSRGPYGTQQSFGKQSFGESTGGLLVHQQSGPLAHQQSFGQQSPTSGAAPPPLPGRRARNAPNTDAAPGGQKAAPPASHMGHAMPARQGPARPKKAEGLDKSPGMIEQLCAAARQGNLPDVQKLLEKVDPDGTARDGTTALYVASDKGHKAIVEALLAAGADPNIGKGEKTPMTVAFQKGNKEILSLLFAASFQSLDAAVGVPIGAFDGPAGVQGSAAEGDVSFAEVEELRDVTARLASLNNFTPAAQWSSLESKETPLPVTEANDSSIVREQAVRMAMKNIIQVRKDGEEDT